MKVNKREKKNASATVFPRKPRNNSGMEMEGVCGIEMRVLGKPVKVAAMKSIEMQDTIEQG